MDSPFSFHNLAFAFWQMYEISEEESPDEDGMDGWDLMLLKTGSSYVAWIWQTCPLTFDPSFFTSNSPSSTITLTLAFSTKLDTENTFQIFPNN